MATGHRSLFTNRQGEGKTGRVWAVDFDAYFGECGDVDNNLPTVDGWNYILRIYEPKLDELQDFRLPEMKKVS